MQKILEDRSTVFDAPSMSHELCQRLRPGHTGMGFQCHIPSMPCLFSIMSRQKLDGPESKEEDHHSYLTYPTLLTAFSF